MLTTRLKQTYVDGTCVEILKNRKHRSDNTSGFRGVIPVGKDKWRVQIGFQGKQYHIGYFTEYNAAVCARLDAEELYYSPFLRKYAQRIER